jgi:hypothetical protein
LFSQLHTGPASQSRFHDDDRFSFFLENSHIHKTSFGIHRAADCVTTMKNCLSTWIAVASMLLSACVAENINSHDRTLSELSGRQRMVR